MTSIDCIGFDGDDTLWHSERYFVLTQERVSELLAPWVDAERFDEALLATERANLARFGYGVKGFLLSMIETAIEISDNAIPAQQIARRGYDPDEVLAEWAGFAAKADTAGLVFDSDPRRVTKGGLVQTNDPTSPPAGEDK